MWPVQNRRVAGQGREAEAWQSMEGFDQESHSENHRLMEERGTQHPGKPAEIRDGKKSICILFSGQARQSEMEMGPGVKN